MIWNHELDSILNKGVPLQDLGINNWALDRGQSLSALEELEQAGVAILGGDVYELIEGKLSSNGDSWYCECSDGEQKSQFAVRSIKRARQFILSYRPPNNGSPFFALVPDFE